MTYEEIELKIRVLKAARETLLFEIRHMRFYVNSLQLKVMRKRSKSLKQQVEYWEGEKRKKQNDKKQDLFGTSINRRNAPT